MSKRQKAALLFTNRFLFAALAAASLTVVLITPVLFDDQPSTEAQDYPVVDPDSCGSPLAQAESLLQ